MKTLCILGASGSVGRLVTAEALKRGYRVKALLRQPDKLDLSHPALEIVKGDVLQPADVRRVVKGTEVVLSLFGHSFDHLKDSPADLQSRGTQNVVSAMKEEGVSKIVSLSGGALRYEQDQPKLGDKIASAVLKLLAGKVLKDADRHAELLRKSGLEWIVVRGARFTDDHKESYRVGWVGVNSGMKIGRADLAHFIVEQIESPTYIRQMPFVSY